MSLPFNTLKPKGPASIVGHGYSGIVLIYIVDNRFVLKGCEVWLNGRYWGRMGSSRSIASSMASLTVEATAYERLGSHPHILKYSGQISVNGDIRSLKLERALGNLRELILECPAPAEQTRLQMAIQISCGMAYMHSRKVFHCDFSYRNVFVFNDWLLKIGDFGGSKIDDQEPLAAEEARYQLPLRGREWEDLDYKKREIFALGCGIYEIITWKVPFLNLTEEEIGRKYANEDFPNTDGLGVGDIIRDCWNEKFEAAVDVEINLRRKLEEEPVDAMDHLDNNETAQRVHRDVLPFDIRFLINLVMLRGFQMPNLRAACTYSISLLLFFVIGLGCTVSLVKL